MKDLFTILILITNPLFADSREIKPAPDQQLEAFRKKLGAGADEYFYSVERRELYIADVNNDGKDEYLLTARDGGSLHTDTILEAFREEGSKLVSLKLNTIMPDGSQMPLRFDDPFLVVENGKTYFQFRFDTDQKRYIWEGRSFQYVAFKKVGDGKWKKAGGRSKGHGSRAARPSAKK